MHAMIDLETLGTRPGSAILSVGAVLFDPSGFDLGPRFQRVIDINSCLAAGLRVDGGTIAWWLAPDRAAGREALFGANAPASCTLLEALADLTAFLGPVKRIWAHGASFDPVLLETAYRAIRQAVPWKYWQLRDTRTLFELAYPPEGKVPDFTGTNDHDALADACRQALAVQRCYRRLRVVEDVAA